MIYGHGDDTHNFNIPVICNFSSNILASQDTTLLQKHLSNCLDSISAYPEPDAFSLAQKLANHYHLSPDEVLITNGATEAIYLIAQTFRSKKAEIIVPTFKEYIDACTIHEVAHQAVTEFSNPKESGVEMVWFCDPNNPDGRILPTSFWKQNPGRHHDTLYIVDRSYSYFTNEEIIAPSQIRASYDNVLLIGSLTKTFAIPGLRLGYIIAEKSIIAQIKQNKMPWSVNALAIKAGEFLLEQKTPPVDLNKYLSESYRFQKRMNTIVGLEVIPSKTHFFLCKLPIGQTASQLKSHLMEREGFLIRDASNFDGLDERYFRVSTQTEVFNNRLVVAIDKWLHSF